LETVTVRREEQLNEGQMDATRSTGYFDAAQTPQLWSEFMQTSMTKIHKGMAAAHHEGGIDMAKAELSYGKDP